MDSTALPFSGLLLMGHSGFHFDSVFCCRVRHRASGCATCAESCPAGALTFDETRFEFDPQACTHCGACAVVCRTQALKLGEGDDSDQSDTAPFVFSKVDTAGTLPQRIPPRRAELLACIDGLAEVGGLVDSDLADGWFHIEVDVRACISCMRCAVFCPTGALYRFRSKMGDIGLKHVAANCVACGLCEQMCPKGALKLVEGVQLEDIASRKVQRVVLEPPKFEPAGRHSMARAVSRLVKGAPVEELM